MAVGRPSNLHRVSTEFASLVTWLRESLPPGVRVAAGLIGEPPESPYPSEEALIARAVAKRQSEFRTGRSYARQALSACGCPAAAIPADRAGAAVWPEGYVGSISHCDGLAIALAASTADVRGLGVDIAKDGPLEADVANLIRRPGELAPLDGGDPATNLMQVFSAKESCIKAYYSDQRVVLEFLDIALLPGPRAGDFLAGTPHAEGAVQIHGRLRQIGSTILSAAFIGA